MTLVYNNNIYKHKNLNIKSEITSTEISDNTSNYDVNVTLTDLGVNFKINSVPHTFLFKDLDPNIKRDLVSIAISYFSLGYLSKNHIDSIKDKHTISNYSKDGVEYSNNTLTIENVEIFNENKEILIKDIKSGGNHITNYKNFLQATMYNPLPCIHDKALSVVLNKRLVINNFGIIEAYIPCDLNYVDSKSNQMLTEDTVLYDYCFDYKVNDRGYTLYTKEEALNINTHCVNVFVSPKDLLSVDTSLTTSVAIVGSEVGYK